MPASRAGKGALCCGYKGMRKEGKEPTMSTLSRRGFIGAGAAMAASIALVGCSSGGSSSGAPAAAGKDLRFVTGGESGTYYALGTLMAEHASTNAGLKVTAVSSGGSKANVLELEDKTAQLAFCQADVASYAYNGSTFDDFKDKPITSFATVASLYEEIVHIVTCDPNIKSVADLKGKNVSVGDSGSGVYFNAVDVLDVYGMTLNDITPTYQKFQDTVDAIKDGKIDAGFITAGAPVSAITDLCTSKQAYLVAIDDEHAKKLKEKSPYYNIVSIPAGTYKGIDAAVGGVSVDSIVLASDSVSEDDVYKFVSDIFNNLDELAGNNAKFKEFSLDKAVSYDVVPYHAGAAKYFKEKGKEVKSK